VTHSLQVREDANKKHCLYNIATKLIKDTRYSVMLPLCGKLVLLVCAFELDSKTLSLMATSASFFWKIPV